MTDGQDGTKAEFLQDAFRFVTGCVLPGLAEDIDGERFRLLVHPSQNYDAAIIPTEGRFEIVLNEGVVDGLMRFCQTYADLENSLLKSHVEELGAALGDEDRALGISFYAGLVFLILHEVAHAAAGHVGFARREDARFHEASDPASDSNFRRMAELEADGMAMALLFAFQEELMTSLECANEDTTGVVAARSRAMLLGVFAAVSLLHGMFSREAKVEESYPYPAVRLLNLCSAYLRVVAPDIVEWRGDDYWFNRQGDEVVEAISDHYKKTVGPTLFILHDALRSLNIASELHAVDDDPRDVQNFMADVLLLLGGGTPHHSEDGRELAELTEGRAKFLADLAPFRELDLWHAVGGDVA